MAVLWSPSWLGSEEFEDTKGVIRIRKSKDRQHNGQKKKDTLCIKLKIEWNWEWTPGRVSSFSSTSDNRRVTGGELPEE